MAALNYLKSDVFPVGTTVGAYPLNARHHQGVRPSGSAIESHVVPSSGTLTFTGLVEGARYVLWGLVGGESRYVQVSNVPYVRLGSLKQRILARREAVGAV